MENKDPIHKSKSLPPVCNDEPEPLSAVTEVIPPRTWTPTRAEPEAAAPAAAPVAPASPILTDEQREALRLRLTDAQSTVQCYRGDLVELTRTPPPLPGLTIPASVHSAPTRIMPSPAQLDRQVDRAWEAEKRTTSGRPASASKPSIESGRGAGKSRWWLYASLGGATLAAFFFGGQQIGQSLLARSHSTATVIAGTLSHAAAARAKPPVVRPEKPKVTPEEPPPAPLVVEAKPEVSAPPSSEESKPELVADNSRADTTGDEELRKLDATTEASEVKAAPEPPPRVRPRRQARHKRATRVQVVEPRKRTPPDTVAKDLQTLIDSVPTQELNFPSNMTSTESLGHADEPHTPSPSSSSTSR